MDIQTKKSYTVGDGQTQIITDPITITYNETMMICEETARKIQQIFTNLDRDIASDRQRVKDDVRKKRIEVMRRKRR